MFLLEDTDTMNTIIWGATVFSTIMGITITIIMYLMKVKQMRNGGKKDSKNVVVSSNPLSISNKITDMEEKLIRLKERHDTCPITAVKTNTDTNTVRVLEHENRLQDIESKIKHDIDKNFVRLEATIKDLGTTVSSLKVSIESRDRTLKDHYGGISEGLKKLTELMEERNE